MKESFPWQAKGIGYVGAGYNFITLSDNMGSNDRRGLQVLRRTSATKGTKETAEVKPCLAVSAITLFCTYPAERKFTCKGQAGVLLYPLELQRKACALLLFRHDLGKKLVEHEDATRAFLAVVKLNTRGPQ